MFDGKKIQLYSVCLTDQMLCESTKVQITKSDCGAFY
jgi:hypothetical protein